MSSCSIPQQGPRPSRMLVIFEIAVETVRAINEGRGRAAETIEAATVAPHTISTVVIQEDGTPRFHRWEDQRLRTEEFGLFRAMVAEVRLEYPTIPPMEVMMARSRARLAGVGAS